MHRRADLANDELEHHRIYSRSGKTRPRSPGFDPTVRRPTYSGYSRDVDHLRDRFSGRLVEETVDIFTKLDRANSRPVDRDLVPRAAYWSGRDRRGTNGLQDNSGWDEHADGHVPTRLHKNVASKTGSHTKVNPNKQKGGYKETGDPISSFPRYNGSSDHIAQQGQQRNNKQTAPIQRHFARCDNPFNPYSNPFTPYDGYHDFNRPFSSGDDAPKQPPARNHEQPAEAHPSNNQSDNRVFDVVHDPSLSTKDITIRIGLPIEQDTTVDLETFCRLRRLGQFKEARNVFMAKLVQHSTVPYILVQYAEMLVVSGDYKGFCELTYPEVTASAADQDLEKNFALLRLVARSDVYGFGAQAVKTVLSVMHSLKGAQLVGSTEIQIFSLCLQVTCYLKSAVHEDLISQAIIDAKTVFEWKSLYSRLLGESRIWDFRDLLVSAASVFGWEETSRLLFGPRPLNQVLDIIHRDWLQAEYDEATVLGLLDTFTSLILQGRPFDATRRPLLSSFADHARFLAEIAQKSNPDNMNTRPFVQWILAKTVTEMSQVPNRPDGVTLQNFMGLLLDQGDDIQLPVFVPILHSSKPGWGMVSVRSNPAQRAAVEVALGAAIRADDFHMQALALKILCLQSQEPSNLMDTLSTLQLSTQGDLNGFLGTCLAKYLVTDSSIEHEALLEALSKPTKLVYSSKTNHMTNPSLEWAKDVIGEHLVASVSGTEPHGPDCKDVLQNYGRDLPQYIADFITENYHLEVPLPTRVSFAEPVDEVPDLWEDQRSVQGVDDNDDGDRGGEKEGDIVAIEEQPNGDNLAPEERYGYADRIQLPFTGRTSKPVREYSPPPSRYDQIRRPKNPERIRERCETAPCKDDKPPELPGRGRKIKIHYDGHSLPSGSVRSGSSSTNDWSPPFRNRPRSLSATGRFGSHTRQRFTYGDKKGQREFLESKIKFWKDGYREGYPKQDDPDRVNQGQDDNEDRMETIDDRIKHNVKIVELPPFNSETATKQRPNDTIRSSDDRCGEIGYSTEIPKSVKVNDDKSELLFSSKILKENTVTVSVRNKREPEKVATYEIEATGILDTTEANTSTARKVSGFHDQQDLNTESIAEEDPSSRQARAPPTNASSVPIPSQSQAMDDDTPLDQNNNPEPSQDTSTSNHSNATDDTEANPATYLPKKKQHLARSTLRSQARPGSRSSRASRESRTSRPTEPTGKGGKKENEWPTVDAEEGDEMQRPANTTKRETKSNSQLSEKALNELNADSSGGGRQPRRRNSDTRATIASNEEAVVVEEGDDDNDFDDIFSVESMRESDAPGGNFVDDDDDLANMNRMQEVPKPPSRRPTVQDDTDEDSSDEKARSSQRVSGGEHGANPFTPQ
ncbi:hypothetical protein B0T20DRAFT_43408 [Sordaria brevicollis]|uniref:Uncharacterized protein n=1 Tax=Sordaria brevicollis TaxID=83679 RepID=A0AAE0P973_SORBR|nr:hypothetical protein B0T20DRAFT_43408 [Sordaria brevicollis]